MFVCLSVCGKDRGSLKIAEQQSSYDDLMRKLEETTSSSSPSPIEVGPDVVLGSSLPNHSDVNVSCLNGQRIQVHVHQSPGQRHISLR